jgi:Domain of unknown function (DUF4055)
MAVQASQKTKTVSDPVSAYESMKPLWKKSRAVCNGERYVKEYDGVLDTNTFANLLLPFSPTMSQQQYNFYKAEAELPGIVSQYAKILIGGLLRKQPQLKLPEGCPEDAYQWIMDAFTQDSSPIVSFLDRGLLEEMQTSRAFIYVDYPVVPDSESLTTEDFLAFKPYPILWNAESIINWKMSTSKETGKQELVSIIVRNYEEVYGEPGTEGEFHPMLKDTVWVHDLFNGFYRIRKYQEPTEATNAVSVNGKVDQNYTVTKGVFELKETIENIKFQGERLKMIPAWPLNGSIDVIEPILTPLIDKEVSLYNKMSRRNHLLYGAATYTPVIMSDMQEDKFEAIVESGLGTWIQLNAGDDIKALETPTAALVDMDRTIAAAIEEMAKMGIRMLTPESAQSGVALDIRNAAQTAQLGTLNTKISNQMADIIAFMLNWRYGTKYTSSDVIFQLSADFNPTPLGADWLRLATEWYQSGLIPRSVWLQILKTNDMLDPDYNDDEGQEEINSDDLVATPREQMDFAQEIARQQAEPPPEAKKPLKAVK